ncbi:MAG: SDR family NAD(P)-dependent oxidoreductase [Hyphomicrobiales bacterium]
MSDTKKLVLVAGAGSGLGETLLRRFSREGFHAVGLARSERTTSNGIKVLACDLTDAPSVETSLASLIEQFGPPEIVVHNPAKLVISPFVETTVKDFEDTWRNMVLTAAILAQICIPLMVRAGGGTFIVSGATASIRGSAKFAAFASAKFALRGLTQSLAREYQSAGVHVVHTILDGIIDTEASRALHDLDPGLMMKPEDIAQIYWDIVKQPKSTWSQELDLRPYTGSF